MKGSSRCSKEGHLLGGLAKPAGRTGGSQSQEQLGELAVGPG